jgi:MFS family permease
MNPTSATTGRLDILTHRSTWRGLILVIYLVYGILVNAVLFGVPLRALNLGASEVVLGTIISGFVSTGLVFSFTGAAICNRFGERSLLIGAFGCYALAHAVGILAASTFLLILAAFTAGLGDMLFTVGGMTYLTHLVKDQGRDLPMNMALSLLRIGSVVGLTGAGGLAESSGFKAVFLAGASLSIVGVLLSLVLPQAVGGPRGTPAPAQGILGHFRAAYQLFQGNPTVRIVAIITSLGSAGWFTFRSSFYLDYLRRIGMSPGSMGLLTGLGSVACIVAPFVYSLVSNRVQALRAVAIGLLMAGLGLAATPLLGTPVLIGAVAIPAQLGDAFRLPGVYSLLSASTIFRDRPTAVAIVSSSFALAALLAGPLWGLVVKTVGLATAFHVAGLATVFATFAIYRAGDLREAWTKGAPYSPGAQGARKT